MPRLRLMLMGLGLIALVWSARGIPGSAYAQVPAAPGLNGNGGAASMGLNLVERKVLRAIAESKKALESGDHASAVERLQSIIDLPQDGFFRPADEVAGRFVSVKQEVESILTKAEPETLQAYEQKYGAEARRLLAEATTKRDPKIAQEVVRRFIHTVAGADAAYWLGSYQIDRADYASALQSLTRLRRLHTSSRFEPQLALRMALCLYRTGRPEKAQTLVREAARKAKGPVQIGGQTLNPGEDETKLAAWMKAVAAPQQQQLVAEPAGWLMQRGNAERNLLLHSSPPFGNSLWEIATTSWKAPSDSDPDREMLMNVKPQIRGLKSIHHEKGVSPLPAGAPLLVDDIIVSRFYDHLSGFDVKTGKEIWRSAENDRLFQMLYKDLPGKEVVNNPFGGRMRSARENLSLMLLQRTWEDLTFTGLSSDGEYVFTIEDLGFLNDLSPQMGVLPTNPLIMRDYNRLCAYEVRTGKLKWELGGPRGDITLNLPGTYFLGAPLPVDGQLYCIAESQAQTLLLTLDSATGKLLWSQTLSQPTEDLIRDANRRRAGTSPALLGEMLICPTGSGLVVAVDIASRALAWAYQYSAAPSTDSQDPRVLRRRMVMMGIPQLRVDPLQGAEVNEWQDGTPIVADGHVILTPRDSSEIHCLSLEDGKIAWRIPRKDGLYVAAVQNGLVIVVGTRSVDALKLSDGAPSWSQPVALMNQAGRGIVTEKHILLPLVSNEVATLDLKTGRLLSRARIHDKAGLGNLIPGPGIIISQTDENLSVFRTLDSISEETRLRLAKNPQDAEALAQRGEFRLSEGELIDGQNDLRLSLKLRKSGQTQTILFESLLQTLRSDFTGQRALVQELEQLAQTPVEFSALYRTWAEGLLTAGELSPAFDILLKLSEPGVGRLELERLDGHRSIRRDRWVYSQLQELISKVDQPTQLRVQAELQQRLTAAKADQGTGQLRKFLQFFGSHPLADDARQALVDRLLPSGYSIEIEQLLSQLRRSPKPEVAGGALALTIRELIKFGHAEDCEMLLGELVAGYASVVCLDNKTGQQLAEDWKPQVDKRVRFAEDWPTGKVETTREALTARNPTWSYDVYFDGDRGPFYRHSQFKTLQELQRLVGLNGWGEPSWSLPLEELTHNGTNAFRAQIRNHLVFLTTGLQVVALNTLTEGSIIRAKVMWNSRLTETPLGDQNQAFQIMVNRPGVGRPRGGMDRWQNPIGMAGAIEDDSIAIVRGRQLILADVMSGQSLWNRTDMPLGSEIFGDHNSVLVLPPDDAANALEIRRSDGANIGSHPVPPVASRLLSFDHSILSIQKELTKNVMTFQVTDVPAEKLTWEHSFDILSQFSVFSETELAVLEPSGMLSLVSIRDGKILWQQQMQRFPTAKEMVVIPDGERLLVLRSETPQRNFPGAAMIIGNNQPMINGQADCLNRATGQVKWTQRIERYGLESSMPQYAPFWVFEVRTVTVQAANGSKPEFHLMCIDKRSGRVLLKATEASNVSKIQLQMDTAEKQAFLTLTGSNQPVMHTLKYTDKELDPPPEPPAEK